MARPLRTLPDRRRLIQGALAAALWLAPLSVRAAADDRTLGPKSAPITVIEYASVTCSHCGHFIQTQWPQFRRKWVDTGRIRFVLREFPTEPQALSAAGFLVARCAGNRYFDVIDALFRNQEQLFATGDGRAWLQGAGSAGGLSADAVTKCLQDEAALKAFEARLDVNSRALPVEGTPTFFINGKLHKGAPTFADLDAAVRAAIKRKAR